MVADPTAPATKQDIEMLMDSIGKLYIANEQWKEEIKRHFDVVVENIRHDYLKGAISDKLSQHEDRIVRLERRSGLRAA